MRLFSFNGLTGVTSGRLEGHAVIVPDDWRDSISDAALDDLEDYLRVSNLDGSERLELEALIPAPAVHRPGKIVCVGLNYAEHVAEGGRPAPERPILFAKFAN